MRIVYIWLTGLILFAIIAIMAAYLLMNQAVDRTYHDTYYVVVQFNFFKSMGVLFAIFTTFYFVIHKWTLRHVPFWMGASQFFLMFVGVLMIILPQHFLGRDDMPRRYVDDPDSFALWNQISSIGAVLCVLSLFGFILIVVYLIFWGRSKPPRDDTFD
jgi:cytochrome c oxidase subunit 1